MDSTTTQSTGVVHGKKLSPSNLSSDLSHCSQSSSSNLRLSRNSLDSNVDSNGSSKNVKDCLNESSDQQGHPRPQLNRLQYSKVSQQMEVYLRMVLMLLVGCVWCNQCVIYLHLEMAPEQNTEREIATENLRREHPRHRRLFALVDEERLRKILTHMLNETQFLSEHGIRSYLPLNQFNLMIVCPKNIRLHRKGNLSVTSSMVKNSKLNIGLRTQRAECLVATVIGEVQSGSVSSLRLLY